MKYRIASCLLLLHVNLIYAAQVAECHGTLVLDGSSSTAKIFAEGGVGKIVIQTVIDTIDSPTRIDFVDNSIRVYNNQFQMEFMVSPDKSASPVEAFRDGAFFVEDFSCNRIL